MGLGVCGVMAAPNQPLEIKLATILPRGLGQDAVLKKLEQDWGKASSGTVALKRAPGGEKDGEATIVRKLHSGNYQAALLSATGLSEIAAEAGVLQMMPLVFRDWEEVDFVRQAIGSDLEQKLRAKGFVLLFWADMGWVNFFSVRKATSPEEFKRMKMFSWAGNSKQVAIMKSLGYRPVALETDFIHSSFAQNMIEAAPLPPAFALGLQMQKFASHALDMNWAPIVGAAVIRQDIWDKIPPDLQKQLRVHCDTAGRDIRAEGRKFHNDALHTLRKGPKTQVHTPSAEDREQWHQLAAELGPKIRGQLVPASSYDDVQRLLKEFRSSKASPQF